MEWVWAAASIVGAFIVGAAVSQIARQILERRRGRLAQLAPAAASLVFSLILVVGLLMALGFVRQESLNELRDDTISYLPRVLSALIVVILGGVAGTIASTATRESIGRSMGRMGEQIPTAIKAVITAFAVILAASQLGIDTTAINIAIAAVMFGLGLAFALVVGFGSRPVATEVASGRALRRLMAPGDFIESADVQGTVVAMHPTAVEVAQNGQNVLLPNTGLAKNSFNVRRATAGD